MGVIKVESIGSYWLLDDDLSQYMRMPKVEAPREYTSEDYLKDFTWLPMVMWRVEPQPVHRMTSMLFIHLDNKPNGLRICASIEPEEMQRLQRLFDNMEGS